MLLASFEIADIAVNAVTNAYDQPMQISSSNSPETGAPLASMTQIAWQENGHPCEDPWRSERGAPAPKRVVLADDTLSADSAYRLACAGTGMLWRGDFQNARLLLQALARRCDAPKKVRRASKTNPEVSHTPQDNFHLHRQAQSQRARTLSMILIQVNPDRQISLRRAPDWREAMKEAWGPAGTTGCVTSLRELLGLVRPRMASEGHGNFSPWQCTQQPHSSQLRSFLTRARRIHSTRGRCTFTQYRVSL